MRQSVLIVISTEKLGIEMPHRNLLVMERTYYRYVYLQYGWVGTIPLYVGIIHVLLHRLDYPNFGVEVPFNNHEEVLF